MSEFIRLWLFYLLLSGFIRNVFKKDVYNTLMGATTTILFLVILKC